MPAVSSPALTIALTLALALGASSPSAASAWSPPREQWAVMSTEPQARHSWCAPAAVAAMLSMHGVSVPQPDLAVELGTTRRGTRFSSIAFTLNHMQSSNTYVAVPTGRMRELRQRLAFNFARGLPALHAVRADRLPWYRDQSGGDVGHALVSVSMKGRLVRVWDPAREGGWRIISLADLFNSGEDMAGLMVW